MRSILEVLNGKVFLKKRGIFGGIMEYWEFGKGGCGRSVLVAAPGWIRISLEALRLRKSWNSSWNLGGTISYHFHGGAGAWSSVPSGISIGNIHRECGMSLGLAPVWGLMGLADPRGIPGLIPELIPGGSRSQSQG